METRNATFHAVCTLILIGLAATFTGLAADSASASRPNILFILSDDYGLDGVGCYGSDNFKTPNLDALAKSGLRFLNAYATPLCGPTRALLNTGRYGFRTGGLSNQTAHQASATNEPAMARVLKQAGYATGQCGKWRQVGDTPGDWGFEEYITDPTASGWFWKTSYTKNGKEIHTEKEVYYPDVCHEFALDFITRHKNKPFFFYYASHLVHGPILKTPDSKPGASPEQLYIDNVAYLDKQVGSLVAHIEKLGLREKTLIIFSADNGTSRASRTLNGRALSGHKGNMLDCGAHVPFIASWKGTTPQDKVTTDLVDFSDLFPTFTELAGGRLPSDFKLDGRSFAPQLRGQKGKPRDWIFVQLGGNWYAREMGWKLNNNGELFDMSDAPYVEKLIAPNASDEESTAARKRLQAVLNQLNPAAGKTVSPDAVGKKGNKKKKRSQGSL